MTVSLGFSSSFLLSMVRCAAAFALKGGIKLSLMGFCLMINSI